MLGDADSKLVKKLSKSRRIIKKLEKFVKTIGLEKRLPKYQSSVN